MNGPTAGNGLNATQRQPAAYFPLPMLLTLALFGSLPLWIEGVGLYSYLGVEVLIWCLYAMGFNLALGYTGMASFGHGAFFGIGAYAMGYFQLEVYANLWLGLLFAMLVAAIFSALVASFVVHRVGIYLSLMTIAFGEMFFFIASKWTSLTGGEDGMLNIKRLPLDLGFASWSLHSNEALFYFSLAIMALVLILLWRLVNSRFGRILQAIRQNDMRASFLGYNVWLFKWVAFTLSGAIAGLAGGLFAMAQEGAYVQVMNLQWSGIIVLMTVIGGGMVSFWGPILGAVVFFVARDVLGAVTETWLLWYGLMFMALIMFQPEGIAGIVQKLRRSAPLVSRPKPSALLQALFR